MSFEDKLEKLLIASDFVDAILRRRKLELIESGQSYLKARGFGTKNLTKEDEEALSVEVEIAFPGYNNALEEQMRLTDETRFSGNDS